MRGAYYLHGVGMSPPVVINMTEDLVVITMTEAQADDVAAFIGRFIELSDDAMLDEWQVSLGAVFSLYNHLTGAVSA